MKTVKAMVIFSLRVPVEIQVSDNDTLREIEDKLYQKAEYELPGYEDSSHLDFVCKDIVIQELKEL